MIGTCKDCKYWTRRFDPRWAGICDCSKFAYSGGGERKEKDGLFYWDAEGYSAGFNTGEDFGCIHFAYTAEEYGFKKTLIPPLMNEKDLGIDSEKRD